MNNLPIYTKQLPLKSGVNDFFAKLLKNIVVPDCGTRPTPRVFRQTLARIYDEIDAMNSILLNSRPIEGVEELQAPRRQYLYKTSIHFEMALKGYPEQIDLEFLANYADLPVFGVSTPNDRGSTIKVSKVSYSGGIDVSITPRLPNDIAKHFDRATKYLQDRYLFEKGDTAWITGKPFGKMPDELSKRLKISENSHFFSEFFVVFEVGENGWILNKEKIAPKVETKDPLIIGRHYSGIFPEAGPIDFLIGAYLPTTIEQYMLENYTLGPYFTS